MKIEQIIEDVRLPLLGRIEELEAENARLRQQLYSANSQLDFILENMRDKDELE